MEVGFVSINGRLVIPSKIRKKYGISTGTKIYFTGEKDGIKIFPVTSYMIKANIGFMKTNGNLLKALMDEKRRESE